jgi:hypothetical protein
MNPVTLPQAEKFFPGAKRQAVEGVVWALSAVARLAEKERPTDPDAGRNAALRAAMNLFAAVDANTRRADHGKI